MLGGTPDRYILSKTIFVPQMKRVRCLLDSRSSIVSKTASTSSPATSLRSSAVSVDALPSTFSVT